MPGTVAHVWTFPETPSVIAEQEHRLAHFAWNQPVQTNAITTGRDSRQYFVYVLLTKEKADDNNTKESKAWEQKLQVSQNRQLHLLEIHVTNTYVQRV